MKKGATGFTLIEVLVALVIVAIALGAGIKAAGALTNNAERLTLVSAGQWCAENLLTALEKELTSAGRRSDLATESRHGSDAQDSDDYAEWSGDDR